MLPGQPAPILPALRVLVVDDVDANCRLARALLRNFGHVSEVATSGLEAVEMAATGHYDVILMDVQLRRHGGGAAHPRAARRRGATDHCGDRERNAW